MFYIRSSDASGESFADKLAYWMEVSKRNFNLRVDEIDWRKPKNLQDEPVQEGTENVEETERTVDVSTETAFLEEYRAVGC